MVNRDLKWGIKIYGLCRRTGCEGLSSSCIVGDLPVIEDIISHMIFYCFQTEGGVGARDLWDLKSSLSFPKKNGRKGNLEVVHGPRVKELGDGFATALNQ